VGVYGFVVGGLALAWGAMTAALDRPDASNRQHIGRLCAVLLSASAAVTVVGIVAVATTLR
jgi:hypothetical protein